MKRIWMVAIILLAGCGSSTTTISREISPLPPGAPVGVAAPVGVHLSWSASSTGGVSAYRVYRGTDPNNQTLLVETSETSYTDTTLEPGNTYYYSVTAVKANIESAESDQLIWGT